MNSAFDNKLDKGTRLSIAQLFRYFLLFFGFLIAIAVVGFDLTNFAIVLSALSVGIGFGLQGLVNNFVSGLILLFERPIREGDTIEVEGIWSEVKKIGLRSTTVQTFDQSDIIIPNADLVYNKVVNWTLTNQRKRIKIEVGVAYGSDVNLVIDTLTEIGSSNSDLVKNHKPVVLFVNFADSTLNFELRVWAKNALDAMQVESDLRKEIDRRFREEKIEIAFPQRDLHIRSVDASISGLTASEKK
ncbi:potassium transporter KefA [Lutibacter sp. HS1-25]|nr:potassium transporter KefA [Lutibacter sp. HS1-25]